MAHPAWWDADADPAPAGFRKYWTVCLVALLAIGGFAAWQALSATLEPPAPPPTHTITFVKLQPMVQPPAPPPPPEPEKKPDFVPAEDPKIPEPAQPPPTIATTDTRGKIPGDGIGRGSPRGDVAPEKIRPSQAAVWTQYGQLAYGRIAAAMLGNAKTRTARFEHLDVRIWPDAAGKITRATLANSTGDPSLDRAICDEVLVGMMMPEPPPAGMPTPINLRVHARRPK